MSNSISETIFWRPIAELPEAYPDIDHDTWIILWSPETGPVTQLLYGTGAQDLVAADKWTFWAALKGPTRPAREALVADFGEEAVRAALEGWDSGMGDCDDD